MATQTPSAASGLGDVIGGAAAWLRRRLLTVLQSLQQARMMQALGEMTDRDLEKIGLTRADIPAYAARLVHGDKA